MRGPIEMVRANPRVRLLALLPRVSRGYTVAVAAIVLVTGALPVAFNVATGFVVGRVPAAARAGGLDTPAGRELVAALALAAILFVWQQMVNPFRILFASRLGRLCDLRLRETVMRASLDPVGIGHLEDPALLDTMSLARGVGPGQFTVGQAVTALSFNVGQYITALTGAVLLARWGYPLLTVVLFVGNLAVRIVLAREIHRFTRTMLGQARALRRSTYFRDMVLAPGAAKEARVFGMRAWIGDRFREHWLNGMREVWRERNRAWPSLIFIMLGITGFYGLAFGVLGSDAVAVGQPGIQTLAVTIGLAFSIGTLHNANDTHLMVSYGSEPVPHALDLPARIAERHPMPSGAHAADGLPAREITFRGLSFAYPGSDHQVYDGLDLRIEAGRSLAIVGANGAGKTTLVKLLARLYDPTAGTIEVDGIDLREVDPRAWQRRIAAIFQDFVQYQLPAADNIGFGAPARASDRAAIMRAAERAGAQDIIEALPHGLDTVLSRQYADGADLSGGQWQRLALARALFAVEGGAGVLVLDEPTANLDVRAEVELFDRFLELTKGTTTILISHRFSTVRRADRIVVLDEGRVIEDGSHDALMAAGGTYASMFTLQAQRFTDDAEVAL